MTATARDFELAFERGSNDVSTITCRKDDTKSFQELKIKMVMKIERCDRARAVELIRVRKIAAKEAKERKKKECRW